MFNLPLILNTTGYMTYPRQLVPSITLDAMHLTHNEVQQILQQHKDHAILLLEGGADINPALYGEENRCSSFYTDRDDAEVAVWRMARALDIPVLGICRGHQLLAALHGGALYQDIYIDTRIRHSYTDHRLDISAGEEGMRFAEIMDTSPLGARYVNTLHHQAVRVVPNNGEVIARTPDGIVEAILYPADRTLGVQWHPELLRHVQILEYMRDRFGIPCYTQA